MHQNNSCMHPNVTGNKVARTLFLLLMALTRKQILVLLNTRPSLILWKKKWCPESYPYQTLRIGLSCFAFSYTIQNPQSLKQPKIAFKQGDYLNL